MPGVIAASVAEVDPAHVRDVPLRPALESDHHQLLVVGAASTHPHVEQGFGVVGLQRLDHLAVLFAGEGQAVPVGAPDQAPDVNSSDVSLRQQVLDRGFCVVGQALVGVAAPIGEVDCVAGSGLLDALRQLREVGGAVYQRPDEVAAGPGLLPEVAGVEHGLRVAALRLGQQPLRGIHRR